MTWALAVLTLGALAPLAIGVLATGDPMVALFLGGAVAALGTLGYAWVRTRGVGWAYAYVAVQFPLTFTAATYSPSVGATLLMVVLVSQSALLLPWWVTGVLVLAFPFVHVGMPMSEGLREGFGTLIAVVFAAVISELLVREQRARAELARAHAQLRDYAAQAERLATAQERNRVARDIHDGLGHSLTVVQMQVKAARAVLPTDPARADAVLGKAQDQAEAAVAEVRRSVGALREPRVLPDSLRSLAHTGLSTGIHVVGAPRALPEPVTEVLFRAAQEAMTNARKHADATRADMTITYAETTVAIEVRDNGTGVDRGGAGYGLVGLGERAEQAGGTLRVEFTEGQGCAVTVEVPA